MSGVRLAFFLDIFHIDYNPGEPPFLLTNIEINVSIICGQYMINLSTKLHSMNGID